MANPEAFQKRQAIIAEVSSRPRPNPPPKAFRPQKVIATFQKDTRPTLANPLATDPMSLVVGLSAYLGERAHEFFVILFVNVKNQIIGYTELTSASSSEVVVHVSGAFREALVSGAAAIITAHQHPTGNAVPSDMDHALWRRFDEAGELLGIPVVDHLVIGATQYFSKASDSTSRIPGKS